MTELPPPPPSDTRVAFLRSRLGSEEAEFAHVSGWEKTAMGEADIVMLVTDRRVLWTYTNGSEDLVLDVLFKDVVAFLGSEGEGGFILEANERRHDDIAAGQTTLALFRLRDLGAAAEIVHFIEESIPAAAARNLTPDIEGTGRHDPYPPLEDATLNPPLNPRQEWSAMRPGEPRKAVRGSKDEEFRARLLEQTRDLLRQGDEFIANARAEMARNTDFEQGFVQLPSASYVFAVGNRERIVEIVADLERGAPLSEVKRKMRRLDKDARAWQKRARRFNVK